MIHSKSCFKDRFQTNIINFGNKIADKGYFDCSQKKFKNMKNFLGKTKDTPHDEYSIETLFINDVLPLLNKRCD